MLPGMITSVKRTSICPSCLRIAEAASALSGFYYVISEIGELQNRNVADVGIVFDHKNCRLVGDTFRLRNRVIQRFNLGARLRQI